MPPRTRLALLPSSQAPGFTLEFLTAGPLYRLRTFHGQMRGPWLTCRQTPAIVPPWLACRAYDGCRPSFSPVSSYWSWPGAGLQMSGDPRAGLSVYKLEGCASCHAIAGISVGSTGPSLDGEGNRRDASWLRAMLPAHLLHV